MTLRQRWVVGATALATVFTLAGLGAGAQEREAPRQHTTRERAHAPPQKIDPRATAVVRRMADYLGSLPSFEVTADTVTELVLADGEKIHDLVRSEATLQHPNKLRAERSGPLGHVAFVYDGNRMMLVAHDEHEYSTTDAPNDLDGALDFARERLGVEAPGADLLYSDAYEGLMREAKSGTYLGEAEVDGVVCEHVAFRSDFADWQLWVERGERPLPRRYVITTNDQTARPEFIVELREWNLNPTLTASTFEIARPEGARRVAMAELIGGARERRREHEAQPHQEGAGK